MTAVSTLSSLYRPLGRTGVHVSPLCLGTAAFGAQVDAPLGASLINRAMDAGINMIDTCDKYAAGRSEEIVGQALKEGRHRDQVILVTKFGRSGAPDPQPPNEWGLSRRYIIRACEASLRRLGTDYIDVFLIHRPFWDVALDETLRALDDLVRSGKVRYIGTSNYAAWELMEAVWAARALGTHRFVVEEAPYNLLHRLPERELFPFAESYGTAVITWSPLAVGFLAGGYRRGQPLPATGRIKPGNHWKDHLTPAAFDVVEEVCALAQEKGVSPSQIALAWVLAQRAVTCPIIGPLTESELDDNIRAVDVTLGPADLARLDRVAPPARAIVADPAYGFVSQPHLHPW